MVLDCAGFSPAPHGSAEVRRAILRLPRSITTPEPSLDKPQLTWRERLLQLLGLLSVEEDERVQESRASDLELGRGRLLGRLGLGRGGGRVVLDSSLLDPGDCWGKDDLKSYEDGCGN